MLFTVKKFNELTTSELYEILKVRSAVFLLEQNIVCQDMDDVDYDSIHFFICDNKKVLAYLRAYYVDKNTLQIGRVLTLNHGKGIGRLLMEKTLDYIKTNVKCEKIVLHSQTHAIGFYEKFGFKTVSEEFMEEGVPHVTMEKTICQN